MVRRDAGKAGSGNIKDVKDDNEKKKKMEGDTGRTSTKKQNRGGVEGGGKK